MTSPDLTCVTVTFNSVHDLELCWSGGVPENIEWIVVDNASRDESAKVAAKLGARVVRLPRNVGFSAANNVGASLASGRHLMFVNPDVQVDAAGARWIAEQLDRRDVLIAPQLVNEDGSSQENGRMSPFAWRKLAHFFGSGSSERSYEVVASRDEERPVVWVIGAAVGMRARTFESLGGWDSSFFVYYEDSDLCLRARQAGIPTILDGRVRWVHRWARATRKGFSLASWKFEVASGTRFYSRYPSLLLPPIRWTSWRRAEIAMSQVAPAEIHR
ncbi:glycosyltransferase family 2 protein [Aeromicrobium sp. CnD17-E]|uniref:glycosyltransferase family 2 protein n=1 Tax=Aeromicrobium sp. CnD17-E TaxID=2954487 RepID=UPI002097B487|nr:glycosyltransferase [Aeromicrobium sp. CnD17-E]MCO7239734.1 glycosyltransferase [Aeromicrobium sp. CnD17-E]